MLGGVVKKDVGGAESQFGRKCPKMLGGRVKKDMGGAESRFGRNCPQMLGGTVKKRCWRGQGSIWEEVSSNVGRDGKKKTSEGGRVDLGENVLKCWEEW